LRRPLAAWLSADLMLADCLALVPFQDEAEVGRQGDLRYAALGRNPGL